MIIEPGKSADEIERRLSALNDPELIELLKTVNRGLLGTEADSESYTSPAAPYWKKRIAAIALAGLVAMSAGAGYAVSQSGARHSVQPKPRAAAAVVRPRRNHRVVAVHHHAAAPQRAAALAVPAAPVVAPVRVAAPAPNEALVRRARAELLHERALVAQEKMELRAQAAAAAWAQAEAVARARAQAQAEAQAEATARRTQEEQAAQNADTARDQQTQDAVTQPPDTGRIATNPSAGYPLPLPGPVDTNCTPSRGGLFGAVIGHIRVGGTTVGGLLRLIH